MCPFIHDYMPMAAQSFARTADIPFVQLQTGVKELVESMNKQLAEGFGIVETRILYKCSLCQKVKVEIIPGQWTIDQIQGNKTPKPNA